ncbi:MAG: SH3 domain-containing protein [Rhodospirillales bacterium]|nr:SH3 domain-containing protein [Rhodospirillales bacterium]
MRRAFAFLAACLVLAVSYSAGSDTVVPSDRVSNHVNIRSEPRGEPAEIVGRLNRGERARFLGSVPYWYHVELPSGVSGYVSKSWTTREPDAPVPASASGGTLALHFVDVGQGDATLIQCPDGQTILVDAGSTDGNVEPSAVRDYISANLDQNRLGLDVLVVTHPDADHFNLLRDVLNGITVGHIFRTGKRTDYYDRSIWDWMNEVAPDRVTDVGPSTHDRVGTPNPVMACGDADVWILAAGVEASSSPKNAMSIVLMIRYGDFEAILTGDATFDTEEVVLARYGADWLDADVLKIGHHGSSTTSTSKEWAETVRPKLAVASASYGNSYGHPRWTVISRLEPFTEEADPHPIRFAKKPEGRRHYFVDEDQYREAIYTTAVNGTVVVTSNGQGFEVRQFAR